MTGTLTSLRLTLHRDRVALPGWIVVIVAVIVASAAASAELYPQEGQRIALGVTIGAAPALQALTGPVFDATSVGGLTAWRATTMTAVLAALMSMLTVIRHTRAEEEAGRAELVGACAVGRHAVAVSAVLLAAGANLLIVLLITGGLAGQGLPLAGALAFGLAVGGTVMDRAQAPATTSRANFVHARGSEVLDRLDALSGLPEESVRAMTITNYAGDRPMMRIRFGDPGLHTAAPPMVISQARVEARLRDRLAELGGRPEWGSALVGAGQDADGVTAALGDGRTVRARRLVGCDGTGSTVRKLAGIGFPGVKVSERFLIVDARLDTTLDRSGTSGWVHPEGMLGAMPMPGGQWRLLAYDPAFRQDKPTEEQIVERMRHILPERTHGLGGRLLDASWASLFSVHRRLADTYRQGRILLAGDFAHAHAPFGGQGMLTGIGDAENLVSHPELMAVYWKHHVLPRRELAAAMLRRAQQDGTVAPDADLDVLIDMMAGAVTWRVLQPDPPDAAGMLGFLKAVYRQAGLYRPSP